MNELPKMWYIKINEKNNKIVQNARYNKTISLPKGYITSNLLNPKINNSWRFEYIKPVEFVEISFETFEKLVLGINKTKKYELW